MPDETEHTPPLKISWFFWIPLGLLLFVLIGGYSARMTRTYTDYDQQRAAERYAIRDKLNDEAHHILTSTDWVNQDKKIIRIPIEEAMAKEVDTLRNQAVAQGGLIPVIAPAPAATNAAPAAAAAPATTNAAPLATPPATNAAPSAAPMTNVAPTAAASATVTPVPSPTKTHKY